MRDPWVVREAAISRRKKFKRRETFKFVALIILIPNAVMVFVVFWAWILVALTHNWR